MSSGCTERADVAERQQVVLGLQAEDVEHRLRPEDAAAREVPVPQPAAATVERGVDAAAHGLIDQVGFARACRLPMEGKAEDQHDEAGGGRERHGERGDRAPGGQRRVARLQDGDLAERAVRACARSPARGCRRASAISSTPAPAPKVVSGCVGPSSSIRRRPRVASVAGVAAATTPSALVRMNWRPASVAHGGSACVSNLLRVLADASLGLAVRGCCRRSAARSATASSAIDHRR